jgi:predicted GIY-YIG superfamily endonuclease
MSFWVYILRCADSRYYTGHTDNLEHRLAQHQHGGFCDFTSRRRPVTLMWSEAFGTRTEALEAERRIKPWSRAKKEALFQGDWSTVSYFARPPGERPSTSLGTSGSEGMDVKGLFVSNEVETPNASSPTPRSPPRWGGEAP